VIEELRRAARALRRRPAYTSAAILTLAIGVGANATVFRLVYDVLLRPLPFPEPERLVAVYETDRHAGTLEEAASMPDFVDLAAGARDFAGLAAYQRQRMTLGDPAGSPERVLAIAASANLLPVLGRDVARGRALAAEDDRAGAAAVALLSDALWRRRFAASPAAIGATLDLDGRPVPVVGILPADLELPAGDVWVALAANASFPTVRGVHNLRLVGRLAAGVGVEAAEAELAAVARRLEAAYPEDNAGRGVHVVGLRDTLVADARRTLWLLAAAVAVVLAVACTNVAGLALVQATARQGEVAVRRALGARTRDLVRQSLAESALLAAVGVGLGALVAGPALGALLRLAPGFLPRTVQLAPDPPLAAFSTALAAAIALAIAFATSIRAGRVAPARALGTRWGESRGAVRVRRGLAVVQIAGAVTLAAAAGVLVRSFERLAAEDPGVRVDAVLAARTSLPPSRYPMPSRAAYPRWPEAVAFYERALDEVGRLPGVERAAFALQQPTQEGWTSQLSVDGKLAEAGARDETRIRPVTPGYLDTVGLPLVAGRDLAPADAAGAPEVVLVNRAFERRYFPAASPLGHSVELWGREKRIVGVVGDERFLGLDRASEPAIYPALAQLPMSDVSILVRTAGDPAALAPTLARAIGRIDPELALDAVQTLSASLSATLAAPRLRTVLFSLFGALALLLAGVGIYGVVATDVARRRRELALRLALGARPRDLVGRVVRAALALATLGAILGLAGAWVASRALAAVLFRTSPLEPVVLVAVAAGAAALALLAAAGPALATARLDPASSLRQE
jgi:predicted permease